MPPGAVVARGSRTPRQLGTVTDVDFSPDDGAVVSLVTSGGPLRGSRLVGCGSYAVVVTSD